MLALWLASSAAGFSAEYPFHLPEGFQIEQVAGPPQIRFPMFAALDDSGRLFVAESSGLDLYDALLKLTRDCRINVPGDRDGDGRCEAYVIITDAGRTLTGVLGRQSPDVVVLIDASGAELRIRKKEIEEMEMAKRSIMLETTIKTLTRDEVRDLLAYLQGLR